MKLRRLAAATLAMMMACTVPVYANEADAVALYQEVEQKSKEMTDVDAYYDFRIDMSAGGEHIGGRLEMNMKANQIHVPEQMRCNIYMRMTLDEPASSAKGPGEAAEAAGAGQSVQVTGNMYFGDGMYYVDMMGTKIRYPMPVAAMAEQIKTVTGLMGSSSVDYMENMTLRTEGENRIIAYTINDGLMNSVMQQVIASGAAAGAAGANVVMRNISGEEIIDASGNLIKSRMKMTMDMTVGDETLTMVLDGDVGYANPGQPVSFPAPNPAEYELIEQQ